MGDLWRVSVGLLQDYDIVAQRHGVIQVLSERSLHIVGRDFEWSWMGFHSLLMARGERSARGLWIAAFGLWAAAVVVLARFKVLGGVVLGDGDGTGMALAW